MSETNEIIKAITAVIGEMEGISKDGTLNTGAVKYSYRRIEDITKVVKPLFAKHGLTLSPEVLKYDVNRWEKTTEIILFVQYHLHHVSGQEIIIGPIVSIGRDTSDKAANKALTQAYKYCLSQPLIITDDADDADGEHIEVGSHVVSNDGEILSTSLPTAMVSYIKRLVREGKLEEPDFSKLTIDEGNKLIAKANSKPNNDPEEPKQAPKSPPKASKMQAKTEQTEAYVAEKPAGQVKYKASEKQLGYIKKLVNTISDAIEERDDDQGKIKLDDIIPYDLDTDDFTGQHASTVIERLIELKNEVTI